MKWLFSYVFRNIYHHDTSISKAQRMKQKQVDRNKRFNRFVYKRKKMKTVKKDLSEELNHSRREKKSKRTFQNEQNLLTLPPWVLINLS